MGKFINERETAEYLGLAVQTLRNWRHKRKGPKYIKIEGSAIRYDINDLNAYMKRNTINHKIKRYYRGRAI